MSTNSTDTLDRPRSTTESPTYTINQTRPRPHPNEIPRLSPLRGGRKPWTAWQDWTTIGLGIFLASTPLWMPGAPAGWFVTLGIMAIAAGLWAAASGSSSAAEWTVMVVGIVLFLSPVYGGFIGPSIAAGTASSLAAGTAWFTGAAIIVLAILAMVQNRKDLANSRVRAEALRY